MNEISNCPKCNLDFRGKDIYQHFLEAYSKEGGCAFPRTIEQILEAIRNYPELYDDKAPSEKELRAMTPIELAAWDAAQMYGWSSSNPVTFRKEIGIEVPGYYDGVALWRCPSCRYTWKRFDWVKDEILEQHQNK